MSKDVIMPALGMAQETGRLLRWLKAPGDKVTKGEMLMEVETDKALVEIEATASGILADVTAQEGDVVPVGQVIARIVSPDEQRQAPPAAPTSKADAAPTATAPTNHAAPPRISPVAARIAAEHGIDPSLIHTASGSVQKEDVLEYIKAESGRRKAESTRQSAVGSEPSVVRRSSSVILASPKARRLAAENNLALNSIAGTGPDGAVLAADVLNAVSSSAIRPSSFVTRPSSGELGTETLPLSNIWRVMVERLSQAWTTIPHFYLVREVNAARLMAWREAQNERAVAQGREKITFTDLLVRVAAVALREHPRANASYQADGIVLNRHINIGLAVAVEDGLLAPVVHDADTMSLGELAARRSELVTRAHAGKLSLKELQGGTFTISNLGMYGVDAFNAIVNPPQAAILAVSRIAERVVPVNHQPSVQPMLTLTLSADHRVLDGARAAQFLDTLAKLVEEPLALLE